MKLEGGFVRTFEPLKVSFDYFGYLKDKYHKELDEKEEAKDKWDDLPIRPALKHSAMSGTMPKEPEHPYEKETFVLTKNVQRAPINHDDMPLPTVSNMKRKLAGLLKYV